MIRPLKLIYNAKTYDENGRYTTTSKYSVNNHRDEILNNKILVPEDSEFWKKLLSHPITAFGYDIEFKNEIPNLPNPRFSKHDTIRALDFWIEHWVYQNQVESVLIGTVNVDHEITLKELILVREKIMKMPVKTKFTRGKIRPSDKLKKKIVFTEAVIGDGSASTVIDPFCHKVVEMTRQEYERMKKIIN